MKARTIIGAALLIAGLFIACCVKDGSSHELIIRFSGIALVVTGGMTGRIFDALEDEDKEDPYIEK